MAVLIVIVLLAALGVMTGGFLGMAAANARQGSLRARAERRVRELEAEVEAYRRRSLLRVYDRAEDAHA